MNKTIPILWSRCTFITMVRACERFSSPISCVCFLMNFLPLLQLKFLPFIHVRRVHGRDAQGFVVCLADVLSIQDFFYCLKNKKKTQANIKKLLFHLVVAIVVECDRMSASEPISLTGQNKLVFIAFSIHLLWHSMACQFSCSSSVFVYTDQYFLCVSFSKRRIYRL